MVGFRPSVPAQWERRVSKVSRRSVVADGSVGSLLPLEIDAGASSNWDAAQAGSSILVAVQSVSTLPVAPPGESDQVPDDIGSPKRCGLNETIVLVVGIPASSLWLGSLVNPRW